MLDVEAPGVMVPVVRSPDNILVLVAGDPARSVSTARRGPTTGRSRRSVDPVAYP